MSEVEETPRVAEDKVDVSPEAVVRFTQNLRYKMVENLIGPTAEPRGDDKDLRAVLKDMDQSALTQRKLSIDEGTSHDGKVALQTFMQLRNMMRDAPAIEPQARARRPTDGVEIKEIVMTEQEKAQGAQALNIDDYVSPDT